MEGLSLSTSDLRLVMIGALSTVAGTVVIWMLAKAFARFTQKESKIVWRLNRENFTVEIASRKNADFRLHELVLENTGRRMAKEISIRVSSIPEHINYDLKKRVWYAEAPLYTGWRARDKSSEPRVELNSAADHPSIILRNLVPKKLISLRFISPQNFELDSIFVDGEFVPEGGIESAFFPKSLKSQIVSNFFGPILFVGAIILASFFAGLS